MTRPATINTDVRTSRAVPTELAQNAERECEVRHVSQNNKKPGLVSCIGPTGSIDRTQTTLSSRLQHWSVQPCVRPLSAAHRAAGHNALRGSGPGHKHAFDNALAQMGCPDRRIDRHCITCCSPFPTFTSRRMFDAISFTPLARPGSCSARLWPSWPRPSGRVYWQARWLRPWSVFELAMP